VRVKVFKIIRGETTKRKIIMLRIHFTKTKTGSRNKIIQGFSLRVNKQKTVIDLKVKIINKVYIKVKLNKKQESLGIKKKV
jgi:hypothetical protein